MIRPGRAAVVICFAILLTTAPVAAYHGISGFDGFEDGDTVGWRGETVAFESITVGTTTDAYRGQYALTWDGTDTGENVFVEWAELTNDTQNLAAQEIEFSGALNRTNTTTKDTIALYLTTDGANSDGYAAQLSMPTNELLLGRYTGGSFDELNATSIPVGLNNGTYYPVTIHYEPLTGHLNTSVKVSGTTYWANGTDTNHVPKQAGVFGSGGHLDNATYNLTRAHNSTFRDDTAEPTGPLAQEPTTLQINLTDTDFGEIGDSVDVEFYHKGPKDSSYSQVGTDTLTSNGTASVSGTFDQGGTHEWFANSTDSYGLTARSNTFEFGVPGNLSLVNETNASQRITQPSNITVFVNNASEDVVSFQVSDGDLDLTRVPKGPSYIIEARSENYHTRVRFMDSLTGNKTMYMLNTSEASVETRFTLTDATGQYPSQSILFISRPINESGSTQFKPLYSDRFGSEGVTLDMDDGIRHRLRIRSPDGSNVQDLGPYRADVSETVELRPSDPAIQFDNVTESWAVGATMDETTLYYTYSDPQQETDSVTVWIYERGNQSNRLRPNVTYYNVGNVSAQEPLTGTENETEWTVRYVIDRDGEQYDTFSLVNNRPRLLPTDIDREWRLIPSIMLLLLVAGTFSVLNREVGAIIVGVVGGILWWTGWLTGATSAAAITLYLFIAVLYNLYTGE